MPYGAPSSGGGTALPESQDIVAGETITVGTADIIFVRIVDVTGSPRIYKADASDGTGYEADGYITSTVSAGGTATVYFGGLVTVADLTLTIGADVFLSTAGLMSQAAPGVGEFTQKLGWATSATSVIVEIEEPIF